MIFLCVHLGQWPTASSSANEMSRTAHPTDEIEYTLYSTMFHLTKYIHAVPYCQVLHHIWTTFGWDPTCKDRFCPKNLLTFPPESRNLPLESHFSPRISQPVPPCESVLMSDVAISLAYSESIFFRHECQWCDRIHIMHLHNVDLSIRCLLWFDVTFDLKRVCR